MRTIGEIRADIEKSVAAMTAHALKGGPEFEAAKKAVADFKAEADRAADVAKLTEKATDRISDVAVTTVKATVAAPKEKGEGAARCLRYIASSKATGMTPWAIAEAQNDPGVAKAMHEATLKALAAGVGAQGGFLIPEAFSSEIIELLRPASTVMSFGPSIVNLPNGNLTIPGLSGGAVAGYIGENTNAPATGITTRQIRLVAKKLAALVPISNDILRFANVGADAMVRDDMVRAVAQAVDLYFIRGDGSGPNPRGLLSYASASTSTLGLAGSTTPNPNLITANVTVTLANITQDCGKLELALLQANIPMYKPGWIMAPRTAVYLQNLRDGNGNLAYSAEMAGGMFRGKPYRITTQIPINIGGSSNGSELYLCDFTQMVVGEAGPLLIDMSNEAAYNDGSTIQAPFSLDQTVIRVIAQNDMVLRHEQAVAVLTDVRWF